jgi:hypothetical protein
MKGAKRTAVTARETAGGEEEEKEKREEEEKKEKGKKVTAGEEEEKKKKGKKVAVEAITIQMGAMSQTMETRKPWDAAGEEEEAVAAVHEVKILYTHKLMLCAARVCVEALPFTRVPLCRLLTCMHVRAHAGRIVRKGTGSTQDVLCRGGSISR